MAIKLAVSFSDASALAHGASDLCDRWTEVFEIESPALEEALKRESPYLTRSITIVK